jgi:predicted nucleic acid-binding protein
METVRILLDTSGYSAFLRGKADIKHSLQSADEIYFNAIIVGELLAGFTAGTRGKRNRGILEKFLSSDRVRFIEIDAETAERYAAIYGHLRARGTPIPTNYLWIAASAMQHGLKVLTTDSHYLLIPQILTEHHEA